VGTSLPFGAAAVLLAMMAGGVAGCSDSSGPPPQPANVTPVDPATAATISIRVSFKGQPPEPKELNLRAVPACAALHSGPVYDQPVQVENGRLAGAVAYIKEGLGDRTFNFPTDPVVIDQRGCLYAPDVVALMVGQPLKFLNSDPEAHNVHGRPSAARGWNFLMSRQSTERTVYLNQPEVGIPVRCDVHPWMLAHVSAFTHPYFGVTGSDGAVTLKQVPPGKYVVAAWHRELGMKEQTVTVEAKGEARVEFVYP
jgi:plastocyanin